MGYPAGSFARYPVVSGLPVAVETAVPNSVGGMFRVPITGAFANDALKAARMGFRFNALFAWLFLGLEIWELYELLQMTKGAGAGWTFLCGGPAGTPSNIGTNTTACGSTT